MKCIEVKNLTKIFKNTEIFYKANFQVEESTIVGLSGKNGTGKTTLLKILAGIILPDEGDIFIYKENIVKTSIYAKKNVSLSLNSEYGFYPQLTIKENLEFLCLAYNKKIKIIENFIEMLGIKTFVNTKFQFCSSGTKIKLWLLSSIIKDAKILLIDELTKSIDYDTKINIYELVKILNKKYKKTIIFVSHNPEEFNILANKILTIKNKQIVEI